MSRHVEPGAGAEYADPRDGHCDLCGHTIYSGLLHQQKHGGSIAWLCSDCVARQESAYERLIGGVHHA